MTSSNVARTLFAGALALSFAAVAPGARAANPACAGTQQADQEQLGQNVGQAQKADQEQLGQNVGQAQKADQEQLGQNVGQAQKADQEQLGQNVGRAQKADQEQLGARGNSQFAMNGPGKC
ncbi:MAG: hypothetical protein WBQ75_03070 [Acetobacteraceae bacterium]